MAYNTRSRWSAGAPVRERGTTVAPTTYILPDLPWAVLLDRIVRDARPGDVIEVYTDAMREHVEQVVRTAGRDDLLVRQVAPHPPTRLT